MSWLHILAGVRTPFVKAGQQAAALSADELGRIVAAELIARTGVDPGAIDEVIASCVGQPSNAQNVARVIAQRAGVPQHVPAMTVHRNCASGFEAVTTAAERMAAGRGSLYLIVATESMSNYPLRFGKGMSKVLGRLARARSLGAKVKALTKVRWRDCKPRPTLLEGLSDPVAGLNMGQTAEVLAGEWELGREALDRFALDSGARRRMGAGTRSAGPLCLGQPSARGRGARGAGGRNRAAVYARPLCAPRHGGARAAIHGGAGQVAAGL